MTYPGQPDWDENALSLGRPDAMDTPTLIEWIQRQLEDPLETLARFITMRREHIEWHRRQFGIYACCINLHGTHPEFSRILDNHGELEPADLLVWNSHAGRIWEILTEEDNDGLPF